MLNIINMKSAKIIILIVIIAVALAGIYFLVAYWGGRSDGGEVEVGVILPLEHKYLLQAQMMKKSADLAVEEINKKAGRQKIELIYNDGGCENNKAEKATEDFINSRKIRFILGGFCESESLAIARTAKEQPVIVLSPVSTNLKVAAEGDNIFNLTANQANEGLLLSRYFSEKLVSKKIAIVRENKEYASTLAEDFKRDFFSRGGSVEVEIVFHPRDLDLADISKQLNNRNFEVLFLISELPATTSQIVSRLKNSGSANQIFVSSQLLISDSWKDYIELDGVYVVMAVSEESSELGKFKENYLAEYKEEVKYPELQATIYSTVYLVEQLADRYGSDMAGMKNYLVNLKKWPHALGSLTFDEQGNRALPHLIYQIKDGGLAEIEKIAF